MSERQKVDKTVHPDEILMHIFNGLLDTVQFGAQVPARIVLRVIETDTHGLRDIDEDRILDNDGRECFVREYPAPCPAPTGKTDFREAILQACHAAAGLLQAAQELLQNARDNGECFIDEDDERYDPANPEEMYPDWAALDREVAMGAGGLVFTSLSQLLGRMVAEGPGETPGGREQSHG